MIFLGLLFIAHPVLGLRTTFLFFLKYKFNFPNVCLPITFSILQALLEKALKARQAQVAEEEEQAANGGGGNGGSGADISPAPHKPSGAAASGPPRKDANGQPGFLAPTKAFQVQSMPAKTAQQVILTDEDLVRQEQGKREYVAAIRRKFKEQHKKILIALKRKNEEDEKKVR